MLDTDHVVFSYRIGDKTLTTKSRPISIVPAKPQSDSHVLEALRMHLDRFEEEQAEMEKADAQMMLEFSNEQGLDQMIRPNPILSQTKFGKPQLRSSPAPAYRVPNTLGWVRHLMSSSLYENAIEPHINDLLATRLEEKTQPDAQPGLTGKDRLFIAAMAIILGIRATLSRLIETALAGVSLR